MAMDSTIRLLRPYRGREAGSVITGLTYGAAEILDSGHGNHGKIAEWAPGAEGYPLGSPAPVRPTPQSVLPVPQAGASRNTKARR